MDGRTIGARPDPLRPGGRLVTLEGHPYAGQPIVLSEFGGIAFTGEQEQEVTRG